MVGRGPLQAARRFGPFLLGEMRCPHCGTASPTLSKVWISDQCVQRGTPGPIQKWGAFACTSCGSVVLAKGRDNDSDTNAEIAEVIPSAKTAHEDIPEPARTFLQQAYETLHAPDAAAVMAGSAVDAMLKELGYADGTVYERINKAVADHKLTDNMGDWAHEVRLGSNRPRHADKDRPHVSPEEAKQSVEFAEALGSFLFVLAKRIERGVEQAKTVVPTRISKARPPLTPLR
jgi:DNA-directed RNA polymerase subunit RPC12/RpoP